jgi:hypothetical protein
LGKDSSVSQPESLKQVIYYFSIIIVASLIWRERE